MKKIREKRERIVRKKGWAKIGIFTLGILFGFLLTIGSIVGVGFWAYKNLTIRKIEKLTNNTFDIGNDSIKKITIEDVVSNISGITSDKNYTIEKLEEDFGITVVGDGGFIPNELYGLDLTPLKQCTLKTLDDGVEDIFATANINTFLNFLEQSDEELGMFANILNTKIDYYYNQTDNKLYEDEELTVLAKFDYEITDNQVTLDSDKDNPYAITDNKISVQFRHIGIESAFNSFDKVTDNLKIYEVLDLYESEGVYYEDEAHTKKVNGVLNAIAGKTISSLNDENAFDDIYLYEVLNLYEYEGNYYEDEAHTIKVNGVINAIADKSISSLTSENTFDDIKLYEVLDLHKYNNEYYEDEAHTIKVNGVINAIAEKSISSLSNSNTFDDIKLYEVLDLYKYNNEYYEDEAHTIKVNGVINSIAEKSISDLSGEDTFNDIYIYEVMNYTYYNGKYYTDSTKSTEVDGVLGAIAGSSVGNLSTAIDDVTLGQALNLTNPTGVLKALQNTEIKNLETKIQDLTLTQALDLDGTETGVLKALSGSKITELKDDIDDLYFEDALGLDGSETGILKSLTGTKITELESKINNLTLGEALGIDESSATGAILSFYHTNINELDEALNPANLDIYKAMGYTRTGTEGNYTYKDSNNNTVIGVMATLAGYKLNQVEDAIDAIKVKDVLPADSPILGLFEDAEKETLTIKTLSSSVVDKMNTATVGKLIDCGLITVEGTVNNTVRSMTIKDLIEIATSYS